MLRAKGYILKNFLQDLMYEKFPATARSHGRVGFHALPDLATLIIHVRGIEAKVDNI